MHKFSLNLTAILAVAPLLLALALTGCVTKAQAKAQARAAFFQGQQQAMIRMQASQARGPSVTIMGEVRNPSLPWTADLTLAKALVAADYYGAADPNEIVILRNGQEVPVDMGKLLNGEDVPLQPQDVVQIKTSGKASAPEPGNRAPSAR